MTITIVSAGLTIIEDKGRTEYTNLGVPVSGAFDKLSHQLACNLINEPLAPVFEVLRGPFQLKSDTELVLAVVGEAKVSVDGYSAPLNSVFVLGVNNILRVVPNSESPVYLAIKGLAIQGTLGSYSHDTLSQIGPAPLKDGDLFETKEIDKNDPVIGSFISSNLKTSICDLRYVPGPHNFEIRGNWQVRSIARSGIRLSTNHPLKDASSSLASFPVMPGAIQVPPSGLPVILGPDCGTTGGYPVAGVIIEADLHKLARLTPETEINLIPITRQEAALAKAQLSKSIANSVTRPNDMGAW